jgi:4-amino-4-deoxy-L-arabinose transferase-like glycosyltransferase
MRLRLRELGIYALRLVPEARLEIAAILMLGLLVLGAGIKEPPLVNWDEATYAEVAHEAVAAGSYLDLTWNGAPYLKKPPMLFWMMAGSFKAFGESELAARLPSVLMGVGTLLLIYLTATMVRGRLAGIFAAMIPLGFYLFIARGGRECATDAPLLFFSTLAIYALGRARESRRWIPMAGAACGFAILSKGLAGLVPLLVGVIAALTPGFATVGLSGALMMTAVAAGVSAPWFVYQAIINGTLFWSIYVQQETVSRIAHHLEQEQRSHGFTLRTLTHEVSYLWPLLLPIAGLAIASVRRGVAASVRAIPPPAILWLLWFALALGAACAVRTKLEWYVLPALIPIALMAGTILDAALRPRSDHFRYLGAFGLAAVVLILVQVPGRWARNEHSFHYQHRLSEPSYVMGMQARTMGSFRGSGKLFFAGIELPTLVYYSGMPCYFVAPAETGFELTDFGGDSVSVPYHELVMRADSGEILTVNNLDDEWMRTGPYDETP